MSKQDLINQGKQIFNNIKHLDLNTFLEDPGNLTPWNNLDFNDFKEAFNDLMRSLELIYENEKLIEFPFNIINGLNTHLNNLFQYCQQFANTKNQVNFQRTLQQIEALRTNLYTWGLKYHIILSENIEEKINLLNTEIQNIFTKKKEIDELQNNIEKLIKPAVAGSLSKSFNDRKETLISNKRQWFILSCIAATIGIVITYLIINSIVGIFDSKIIINLLQKSNSNKENIIWLSIILRLAILIPIYSTFGFAYSQYKKERDLEEQYAHKSAVATSLPNYGDLAIDDNVKDQILSEASKVIFHTPSERNYHYENREFSSIDKINTLLKELGKIISKTKE